MSIIKIFYLQCICIRLAVNGCCYPVLYVVVTIYVDRAANCTWVQMVYRVTTWPAKILEHHQNRAQPRTIHDNSSRSQTYTYALQIENFHYRQILFYLLKIYWKLTKLHLLYFMAQPIDNSFVQSDNMSRKYVTSPRRCRKIHRNM